MFLKAQLHTSPDFIHLPQIYSGIWGAQYNPVLRLETFHQGKPFSQVRRAHKYEYPNVQRLWAITIDFNGSTTGQFSPNDGFAAVSNQHSNYFTG